MKIKIELIVQRLMPMAIFLLFAGIALIFVNAANASPGAMAMVCYFFSSAALCVALIALYTAITGEDPL